MAGFEILEHTADVGLRATAESVTGVFEQATRGLAEIAGIWRSTKLHEHRISVEGSDREAVLVDWLSEVLFLHDSRNFALSGVSLDEVTETSARGRIWSSPLDGAETAIQIKAVTYHQLAVQETAEGWSATVFFDI